MSDIVSRAMLMTKGRYGLGSVGRPRGSPAKTGIKGALDLSRKNPDFQQYQAKKLTELGFDTVGKQKAAFRKLHPGKLKKIKKDWERDYIDRKWGEMFD